MKIFMTGISGRIGSVLSQTLLEQGHMVRGLVMPDDPLLTALQGSDAELFIGSLFDKDVIARGVQGVDAVVHLAAIISYLPQDDELVYRVNVQGTRNVFEAASRFTTCPAHLVFASTDATYPSNKPLYRPLDETHPQMPTSLYGLTKILGEQMVQYYARSAGLPYTITRFSFTQAAHELINPHGTFAHRIFFVNGRLRYLKQLADESPGAQETITALENLAAADDLLLLPYDAQGRAQVSEVTDARDIAQGLRLALERPEARNQAFNLGPATAHSFAEVIPYMARATGRQYVETTLPTPALHVQTSNRKARMLLGYHPRYTVFDMIDEACNRRGL